MKLNTSEILSSSTEELMTSGITYHRIISPSDWGDITANRSLYGYEVDRNFYNLKAQDIKSAYAEDNSIYLVKWNGDKYKIDIDKLNELAELIDNAEDEIAELSGITLDFITEVKEDYCTKEEAETIAKEAADEVREEVEESKYLTKSDLLTWAINNIKTINCMSLIGQGNICIDCCGGGGEGQFQLLSGDAIRIDTNKTDKSMTVNVVVESGTVETVESEHESGKNFLHIVSDSDHSWLSVDGVDADSIYISEDINLGGTALGDFAKQDSFPDGIIPKGITLQNLLVKLFCGEEDYGKQEITSAFNITKNEISITVKNAETGEEIEDGSKLAPGTKLTISIDYNSSVSQSVAITGFVGGYKIGDEIKEVSSYSKIFTPTLVAESSSSSTFDVEGDYFVVKTGKNVLTVTQTCSATSEDFDDILIYPVSNKGNVSTSAITISKAMFEDIVNSFTKTFTVTTFAPYYYGYVADIHDFSDASLDHEAFIKGTQTIAESQTEATSGTKFYIEPVDGSHQLILAYKKDDITSFDAMFDGFNFYDDIQNGYISTNKYEITIDGNIYIVWTYIDKSARGLFNNDKFEITFN